MQFEKLLDLKQRQANVDEARLARYQADLASAQSRAVLVFTVGFPQEQRSEGILISSACRSSQ